MNEREYKQAVSYGFFRKLSPRSEATFRKWARDNYKPIPPNLLWHPVVQDEWNKIAKEKNNE